MLKFPTRKSLLDFVGKGRLNAEPSKTQASIIDISDRTDARSPSGPTAFELFELARTQQSCGDVAGVLATARQLIALHSRKTSGFTLAANALIELGRAEEAMAIVTDGLSLHPDNGRLHGVKLRLHLLGRHKAEIGEYEAGLEDSDSPSLPVDALFDLARHQLEALDFTAAEVTARNVVAAHPEKPSSFQLLAQVLLNLNKPDEALAAVQEGLAAHPDQAKLYRLAYVIEMQLGQLEEALGYAEKFLTFEPSNEKAHYAVYLCKIGLARFDQAEKHLELARQASPEFDYGKHSFHFRQYKRLQRELPSVAEAWEAGLTGKGAERPSLEKVNALPVIQYWSQGAPPSDVGLVVKAWNRLLSEQGLGPVAIYDRQTAGAWIVSNAPEFTSVFQQAFDFAMESDIFRIAYASRLECLYLDIDSWPIAGIGFVLNHGLRSESSMLYFRTARPYLNNSLFIARKNCRFFAELVRQCAAIDLALWPHTRETISSTFGPDRYNSVFHDVVRNGRVASVSSAPAVEGVSKLLFEDGSILLFANEFATAAQKPPFPLHYKSTSDYWKAMPAAL